MNHHRIKLIASLLLLLPMGVPAFGGELVEKTLKLRNVRQEELEKIRAGQTGINGYALFGENPPEELMTGDDYLDQRYSSPARIRMLEQQLLGLRRVLMLVTAEAAGMDRKAYADRLRPMDGKELDQELWDLPAAPLAEKSDVYVLSIYLAALHRPPTLKELEEQTARLEKGEPRDKLAADLLNSKEYQKRDTSNLGYLRDAWQVVIGQNPSLANLDDARDRLSGGTSRKEILKELQAGEIDIVTDTQEIDTDDDEIIVVEPDEDDGQAADTDDPTPDDADDAETLVYKTGDRLVMESFGDEDDFEDDWRQEEVDDAEVDDGILEYELDEDDGLLILRERIPADGVEIRFRGKCKGNGWRVMMLDGDEPAWGVQFAGDKQKASTIFGEDPDRPLESKTGTVCRKKAWQEYRIRCAGGMVEAWCEGRRVLATSLLKLPPARGNLAIGGNEDDYELDWVKVFRLKLEPR